MSVTDDRGHGIGQIPSQSLFEVGRSTSTSRTYNRPQSPIAKSPQNLQHLGHSSSLDPLLTTESPPFSTDEVAPSDDESEPEWYSDNDLIDYEIDEDDSLELQIDQIALSSEESIPPGVRDTSPFLDVLNEDFEDGGADEEEFEWGDEWSNNEDEAFSEGKEVVDGNTATRTRTTSKTDSQMSVGDQFRKIRALDPEGEPPSSSIHDPSLSQLNQSSTRLRRDNHDLGLFDSDSDSSSVASTEERSQPKSEGEIRRERALAHLESYPLQFLGQLLNTTHTLDQRTVMIPPARMSCAQEPNSKKRKVEEDGESRGSEDEITQDEEWDNKEEIEDEEIMDGVGEDDEDDIQIRFEDGNNDTEGGGDDDDDVLAGITEGDLGGPADRTLVGKNSNAPKMSRQREKRKQGMIGISMSLRDRKTGADRVIQFPDLPSRSRKKMTSMRQITCILRIASLMYEAILTDCVTTKRDIYYKDVKLFKSQSLVDKMVDDIIASADLKRGDFNVRATMKGLVISKGLKVMLKSGERLALSGNTGCLIPPSEDIDSVDPVDFDDGLEWVLVVEKDAIFQTLCSLNLLSTSQVGPGAIVTAKGYPDLATIQFLASLRDRFPSVRFHCLVDADPAGIAIMNCYTYGSRASRFSEEYRGLALGERLGWLGVRGSELIEFGIKQDDLLELSQSDVNMAMRSIRDPTLPMEWRKEIGWMLHTNRKAEIQILSANGGKGLLDYVVRRLRC